MVAVDTRHRSEVPTTRRVIQELHELRSTHDTARFKELVAEYLWHDYQLLADNGSFVFHQAIREQSVPTALVVPWYAMPNYALNLWDEKQIASLRYGRVWFARFWLDFRCRRIRLSVYAQVPQPDLDGLGKRIYGKGMWTCRILNRGEVEAYDAPSL